jgi:autotransporter-associated beta strand protein
MSHRKRRFLSIGWMAAIIFCWSLLASGIDISDVQPAAMDQPQINVLLKRTANGQPLTYEDWFGGPYFNITAYFDTGASGILLSESTAQTLGIVNSRYPEPGGPLVTYEDVGVGGSSQFYVSEPLYVAVAKFHPDADVENISTYKTVYNQSFGPVRLQIGPTGADPNDPLLGGLDVVGVPAMAGKVVVMDPTPVDTFLDTMRTYVYNPGTPFNAAKAASEPGIPVTNRHIRLSSVSFDQFTNVTPTGAPGPTLRENPFIGPNPVAQLDGVGGKDTTPGVTIGFGGVRSTGSFLLDTGASTSIISMKEAANLHVRYVAGTEGTDTPMLERFDPANPSAPGILVANQFQLAVGGIGGTTTAAGFYLDSMLLKTMEGDPGNDQDPNHLLFHGAPVLVSDITVQDPITQKTLTLDGVFGMNYMVASISMDYANFAPGNFNWLVYDQPNGILGLDTQAAVPTSYAVWSGGGSANPAAANMNWSNPANWESGAPNPANGVRFALPQIVSVNNFNDFAEGTQFNGIIFSGQAAFNLQGHSIVLMGNVINISSQTQTISLDMQLSGATRTFNADSGDIVVQGRISGDQGFVKTGDGTLTLKASNSYTGTTTISSGTLVLAGNGQISTSSPIVNNAIFEIADNNNGSGHAVGAIFGTGDLTLDAGAQLSAVSIVQGTVTLGVGSRITIAPIGGGFSGIAWQGGDIASPTNWGNAANWNPNTGIPSGAGVTVSFGSQAASNNIVDMISSGQTVGNIKFTSSTSTTIRSSGGFNLTLDNLGGTSTINTAGTHEISAPVILNNDVDISGTGTLILSGGVSGAFDLNVSGNLTARSIDVDTVTLGVGARITIMPIPGGPSSVGGMIPVPEPSVLIMLAIAGLSVIPATRRLS